LRRPKCKWENNIKVSLKEIGCEFGMNSSGSRWTFVNRVMNLQIPQKARYSLPFVEPEVAY